MKNTIEITLPARTDMMLVVRLTTAGVLARSGLTVETMEDVKIAAEEACNCLIRSCRCALLSVAYHLEEGSLVMKAQARERDESAVFEGVSDDEISVVRCVLLSLMDQVELSFDDGCLCGFTLRKQLAA